MNKIINYTFILLSILLITHISHSQENKATHYSSWNSLTILKNFSKKWSVNTEFHFRRTSFFSDWEQFIIRPSIHYKFEKDLDIAFGYSYIQNYSYSKFSIPVDAIEKNIFQQLILKHKFINFILNHRLRFEERYIDNIIQNENQTFLISGTKYRNRFRYKFQVSLPVINIEKEKSLSFVVYDEAFLDFGNSLSLEKLDQNWMFIGFVIQPNNHVNIRTGYQDVYVKRNELFVNNKIWETTLTYKI